MTECNEHFRKDWALGSDRQVRAVAVNVKADPWSGSMYGTLRKRSPLLTVKSAAPFFHCIQGFFENKQHTRNHFHEILKYSQPALEAAAHLHR